MHSWPSCQLAGVATLCFAVNCNESITRSNSRKFRPVEAGYVSVNLIFLSGPMMNTDRTVKVSSAFG